MTSSMADLESAITGFDFRAIFVEVLGWDHYADQPLNINVAGHEWALQGIAEKRGRVVYVCNAAPIPDYPQRCAIERMVTKTHNNHFIVFTDDTQARQVWQYARRVRTLDRAIRPRYFEMAHYRGQQPTALAHWLEHLKIDFAEEETLTSIVIDAKAEALAVERVTKNFYNEFAKKQQELAEQIIGLESADCERYASLLMNRLMFTYFIQSKGLLVGDNHQSYLRHKLTQCEEADSDGSFFTYYKRFLLKFFHDGLGTRQEERAPDVQRLIGDVPYLNGGLFEPHRLEIVHDGTLNVPNAAFHQIFDFFDKWDWQLDTRANRDAKEINPDILGYIFEKYINQKQMGAYYTKEDITEYISKNTIIPYLFDAARERCAIAFVADGSVWGLLRADPDRYIFPAVLQGVDAPLPDAIAAGITDVAQRGEWNKPAPAPFTLPTETWREHVARRQRCHEVRGKLAAGAITQINDLITYNLDIITFARDVIETCEGKDLVAAFYEAIAAITVLDPTCGSGAFLFAALNILAPLYDACLDRMEGFVREDEARLVREGGRQRFVEGQHAFRTVLAQAQQHPSRDYFILKSIIVQNLYGVDIMAEAVEIAKLRLFLKLAAQAGDAHNIEPLPDIDFNIRAGNTLVGYATKDEVEKAVKSRLIGNGNEEDRVWREITESATSYARDLTQFRAQQTNEDGGKTDLVDKVELQHRLRDLNGQLDRYLAWEYAVAADNSAAFAAWKTSYQPFHWYAEFHSIIENDGFRVILGNPPYLEMKEVDYRPAHFECEASSAIHAMCIERGAKLLSSKGTMSMIVPLALVSTQRMLTVQHILEKDHNTWYANYSWRPGKLFDTVNRALTIFVIAPITKTHHVFSTCYQKWTSDNRDLLMNDLQFTETNLCTHRKAFWIPKLRYNIEQSLLEKSVSTKAVLGHYVIKTSDFRVYYRTTGGLYWKVFTDFAPQFRLNGAEGHSTRETWVSFSSGEVIKPIIATLSSGYFWWWYTVSSNCRDLNPFDIYNFPFPVTILHDAILADLGDKYLEDIKRNSTMLTRIQKQTGTTETQSFKIQKSKAIIDEIDQVLAKHYGFTAEECDFIINYDIKYRMGRDTGAGDDTE